MPKQFVWRPKTQRIEDDLRDKYEELEYRWHYPPKQPEMRAYEGDAGERIERELPWLSAETEEEWRKSPMEAERQAREWMPWIGLGVVAPFLPAAPAAFGAASKIPWRALRYPTKALLGAIYPEKPLGEVFKLGKGQVGKLVGKAKEQMSTILQKLEAHRIADQLGLERPAYEKLAKEITGKISMTKMTMAEGEKFVQALAERFGYRHPELPFKGTDIMLKGYARETAKELAEYIGRAKPPKQVLTKAARRQPFFEDAKQKVYGFTNRTYRMERIFDRIDGYPKFPALGKMASVFWKPVNQAMDTKLSKTYAILDEFRGFLKLNNVNLKDLLTKKMVINDVEFTTGERMGVYLNSLNQDNLRHMKWGSGLDDDLVKSAIDSLSNEEKLVADWLFKQWQSNTPRVAEAYKAVTGKNMKIVENYVPIVVRGEDIAFEDFLSKEVMYRYARRYPSTMMKKGFTKARTHKAKQPLELDAMQIWVNRLPEVEHYISHAPVIRDLQRIYNDMSFKNSLIKSQGKAVYEVLGQWLKDVAATNPMKARSASEKIWQQARVNAVTAVLGWNITTCLKQFPSFMIGAGEIGNVNAIKGFFTYLAHSQETHQLIKKLAPQIWKRSFEREIAEAKLLSGIGHRITGRLTPRELFMIMTTSMDKLVVNTIWRGAFDNGLKRFGEEKIAAEYATRAIRRTQPYFGVKDVPEFWRAGEGMKALTMFTNQLNQYWNYYRHDVYGAWQYRNLSTPEALKKIIEGFVAPALMIGSITRSDVPRDAKEFITDLGGMALATVPIFGHYLTSGFRGWGEGQGLITTEILDKLNQMAYQLNPERWDRVFEEIPKLAELAGQIGGFAAGVPVTQPTRTIKAMIELAQGNSDDLLELIWGSYVRRGAEGRGGGGSLTPYIELD